MNFNITIGQYYPCQSKIHSLDPRTKLMAAFVYITALFIVKNVWGYILCAFALAWVIILSKVPFKYMLRGLRGIFLIIIFTFVMNLFFSTGDTVIYTVWKISLTLEGIYMAAAMSVRLCLLVMASSILTLTTSPIRLTDGLERALSPFKAIGVPSHEIAMMMSIALRFIPTLFEETDKIMKAQMARGAEFDTGGLREKAKSLIPLLVPLFISSFRRADDLAMAMEARCYRGDINRTKMNEMAYQKGDYTFYGCMAAFFILAVASRYMAPL